MNQTSETSEIWYDASPLTYDSWKEDCIKTAPENRADEIRGWLSRYYMQDKPLEQLIRGVTTNPPLSLAAIKNDPVFWKEWVLEQARMNPEATAHEIWWSLYKETIKRGAEKYFGLFRQSRFKYGFLSAQVDPRTYKDERAMIAQAVEISSIASNIMIKIPAIEEGLSVIKTLTSKGISTNATLGEVIPQYVAVAEAVKAGFDVARKDGVDLSKWRSVITMMVGRYEELGRFKEESEELGIELTDQEIKWSTIAILKKTISFLKEGGYPSKMLLGSMRPGPVIGDRTRVWYFEKLAGADAVFTCGPKFINAVDIEGREIEFDRNAINEPVPEEVIEKLSRFKYFCEAYDPKGLEPPQFIEHPAVKASLDAFIEATNEMEDFVEKVLQ